MARSADGGRYCGAMSSRRSVRTALRRAWVWIGAGRWRQIGAGVVAGVLLAPVAIAAVGGFATADDVQAQRYAVGQRLDLGQVEVEVRSTFLSAEVQTHALPEEASAWLGVVVEVVNRGDEEVILSRDLLRVPGLDPLQEHPRTTVVVSDESFLVTLSPDVPHEVAMLWPLAGSPAAQSVEVELYPVLAQESMLDPGSILWQVEPLLGVVEVPVTDVPPTLVDEED